MESEIKRVIEILELAQIEHRRTDSSRNETIKEAITELKQLESDIKAKGKPDNKDRKVVAKVLAKVFMLFKCVEALADYLSDIDV